MGVPFSPLLAPIQETRSHVQPQPSQGLVLLAIVASPSVGWTALCLECSLSCGSPLAGLIGGGGPDQRGSSTGTPTLKHPLNPLGDGGVPNMHPGSQWHTVEGKGVSSTGTPSITPREHPLGDGGVPTCTLSPGPQWRTLGGLKEGSAAPWVPSVHPFWLMQQSGCGFCVPRPIDRLPPILSSTGTHSGGTWRWLPQLGAPVTPFVPLQHLRTGTRPEWHLHKGGSFGDLGWGGGKTPLGPNQQLLTPLRRAGAGRLEATGGGIDLETLWFGLTRWPLCRGGGCGGC